MSNNVKCLVIHRRNDGVYHYAYSMCNGTPDITGKVLADHYQDEEKIENLLDLGTLYKIRRNLNPDPNSRTPHVGPYGQPLVTLACGRDGIHEASYFANGTIAEIHNLSVVHGVRFVYLNQDGQWWYCDRLRDGSQGSAASFLYPLGFTPLADI